MTAPCPVRLERIAELFDALPARCAWLVGLLEQHVRRQGPTTIGELIHEHAGAVFSERDIVRAVRAGERHRRLEIADHEHARLVGLPGLYDQQAAVWVTAPERACHPEAVAA